MNYNLSIKDQKLNSYTLTSNTHKPHKHKRKHLSQTSQAWTHKPKALVHPISLSITRHNIQTLKLLFKEPTPCSFKCLLLYLCRRALVPKCTYSIALRSTYLTIELLWYRASIDKIFNVLSVWQITANNTLKFWIYKAWTIYCRVFSLKLQISVLMNPLKLISKIAIHWKFMLKEF